jgi:hypothetical protein
MYNPYAKLVITNKPNKESSHPMARAISVKIPVSTLISDIENSIAKIDEAVANYADEVKAYKQSILDYNKVLVAKVIEAISDPTNIGTDGNSPVRISTNYRGGVSVDFDSDALGFPTRPSEPTKPNDKTYFGREYTTRKEILEKNLRILRMTLQEEVSASSYSSVIDLI